MVGGVVWVSCCMGVLSGHVGVVVVFVVVVYDFMLLVLVWGVVV